MRTQRLVRRSSGHHIGLLLVLWLSVLAGPQAQPATLPAGFTETLVASGLASPTAMQFAPDGRLFVCRAGRPAARHQERRAAADAVPHRDRQLRRASAACSASPSIRTSPPISFVYVYYTATTPAVHNRVSRFTANGDVAVAGSEVDPARARQPEQRDQPQRRRAALRPRRQALRRGRRERQRRQRAVARATCSARCCASTRTARFPPTTRSSRTATGNNRAIWALGLRNPFTFAFNPAPAADVHQRRRPEHLGGDQRRRAPAPTTAGRTPKAPTTDPRFVSPRYAYDHAGGACAITGGAFYTPPTAQFPADYLDDYFFADYCGGWIRKLDPAAGNTRRDVRDRHRVAGRSEGRRRRQPVLPRARHRARRPASSIAITTARRAQHHHASGEPDASRRARR